MNKTLLINKVNPQDFTKQKKKIFFLIGDTNVPEVENHLMNALSNSGLIEDQDIVHKYNGVELFIDAQTIPVIIKLLSKEGFSIYGVYELYNPDL